MRARKRELGDFDLRQVSAQSPSLGFHARTCLGTPPSRTRPGVRGVTVWPGLPLVRAGRLDAAFGQVRVRQSGLLRVTGVTPVQIFERVRVRQPGMFRVTGVAPPQMG